ncbi:MAG: type II secretion system protein [Candidatus Hydrogenedentes bacterium]|nr:type II secretion system protein [Candidatus Hydrogenedentota bacterium]MBI3119055.1 type II secretion system protein [Candidatus Hydrogenedentota bacterium]
MRGKSGHTLIETLVVLAIISILMAFALPGYVRAIRMAKQVAADEAKRQTYLIREADKPAPRTESNPQLRQDARAAFRRLIDAGNFDIYVSELLFVAENDAEFGAYWNTLLNPSSTVPIVFEEGMLVAVDESGQEFLLPPTAGEIIPGAQHKYATVWDFISTNMSNMSLGNLGTSVVYSDGTREYIKYPGNFPATPTVAMLSQRFMDGQV